MKAEINKLEYTMNDNSIIKLDSANYFDIVLDTTGVPLAILTYHNTISKVLLELYISLVDVTELFLFIDSVLENFINDFTQVIGMSANPHDQYLIELNHDVSADELGFIIKLNNRVIVNNSIESDYVIKLYNKLQNIITSYTGKK